MSNKRYGVLRTIQKYVLLPFVVCCMLHHHRTVYYILYDILISVSGGVDLYI